MQDNREDGFGIIEVIVSMVIFALLALALAPVLLGGVKASIKMTSIATATQFVNQGLEAARGTVTSCAPATPPTSDLTDSRGVLLRRTTTVTPDPGCATNKLVQVQVVVKAVTATSQFSANQTISSARTVVYVG